MTPLPPETLERLQKWITAHSGLRGEDYRSTFLDRRISPRLRTTACATVEEYLDYIEKHGAERRVFLDKLLVPTTEFFRNPEVFEQLGALLRDWKAREPLAGLRILSAPCSTGEEAVSLAILLREIRLDGRIIALDRSRKALRKLQAATFPARTTEKLDRALRERYFKQEENSVRVDPAIIKTILPVCGDLTFGIPGTGYHVIALRNIFIYLTEEAQNRLLGEAERALVPNGLLILGRVESLGRKSSHGWRTVVRDARIYARGRAE